MDERIKRFILKPLNLINRNRPDLVTKLLFLLKNKYRLNLKSPKTFNEKLNWMKLYYKNDLMPICSDKLAVREYVKSSGLENILTKVYWEGKLPENIPYDELPMQFVIKVTHGSGYNIICKDKTKIDTEMINKKLHNWLNSKYLPSYGEWFYGIVPPSIIIEEYLVDNANEVPKDYKLYHFNNINSHKEVGFIAVHTGRFTERNAKTIYDTSWKKIDGVKFGVDVDLLNYEKKPKNFDLMIEYTKILAKPFPHARIDFYEINDKLYFGEITFITGAGFSSITPRSYDDLWGSWIELPE